MDIQHLMKFIIVLPVNKCAVNVFYTFIGRNSFPGTHFITICWETCKSLLSRPIRRTVSSSKSDM